MGVMADENASRAVYSALLSVEGTSFGLASQEERERRLAAWGTLVASLGGSHVARLQIIARVVPADPAALAAFFDEHRAEDADPGVGGRYAELLDEVRSANVDTQLGVAVLVELPQGRTVRRGETAGRWTMAAGMGPRQSWHRVRGQVVVTAQLGGEGSLASNPGDGLCRLADAQPETVVFRYGL